MECKSAVSDTDLGQVVLHPACVSVRAQQGHSESEGRAQAEAPAEGRVHIHRGAAHQRPASLIQQPGVGLRQAGVGPVWSGDKESQSNRAVGGSDVGKVGLQ